MVIPFILPAFVLYTVLFVYPAIRAVWVSLHDWSGFGNTMVFVGLGNYREMLQDSIFWGAFQRTLIISFGGGIGIFALAMIMAAVLQRDIRGKRFFRALIFFPNVVQPFGLGLIWQFLYNNKWGPISGLLNAVGLEALDPVWLGPKYIIPSLTVAVIWTYVGYYMVILTAGIDKIPKSYYEAAIIDGASFWQMFFTITIPMVWDVLVTAIVLWVIGSLKVFDLIIATTFPDPPKSTFTMTIYVWQQAVGAYTPVFRLGYATALGVVLLGLIIVSVAVVRTIMGREAIEY